MQRLEDLLGDLKIYQCVMFQQWFVVLKSIENSKIDLNQYLDGVLQLIDSAADSIQLQNFKEKMTQMLESQ